MSELNFLKHVSDPLLTGIAMVREVERPGARRALLEEVLSRHGSACSVQALEALLGLGRDLVSAEPAETALLKPSTTPAGIWLAAGILESSKQYSEAAAAFESMPDLDWSERRAMRLLACARNRIRAGQIAWPQLRGGIQCAETRKSLTLADQLLKRAGPAPTRIHKRLALLGTGSLPFWAPILRPVAFAAGIGLDIHVGQYDQYRQEILDPDSPLAEFRPEIVILATDWRALALPEEGASPEHEVSNLRTLWESCATRWGAAVIQHNFEVPEVSALGNLSAIMPGGRARVLRRINAELADSAVTILDLDQIASLYGKQRWSDPTQWIAAKQYPHSEALPFLARHQIALLRAVCGLASKCAVLDLDGTLWGGVIGEDGLEGIRLGGTAEGESYLEFQRYLIGLRDRGIPLAVCSKNNPEDALEPFRRHPEMLLKVEDFAVFRANWESKPDNLRAIAGELQLGIESLVFIDDHPLERARVRAELPEVEVPEMPTDPALYATALHRTLLFESVSLTGEDRKRADSYRQNAERQTLQASSAGMEDFLAGLGMRIELKAFDRANLPRIVQLINKTNQFNLTTRRMSSAEVEQLIDNPQAYTQFMRLHDRFGDNGISGILIAIREGSSYRIHQWLLSCRVLGRRVEDVMLIALLRHASAQGATEVIGEYVATAKNSQVAGLYPKFGFEPLETGLFRLLLQDGPQDFPAWATVDSL